jgi:hypothetical protein
VDPEPPSTEQSSGSKLDEDRMTNLKLMLQSVNLEKEIEPPLALHKIMGPQKRIKDLVLFLGPAPGSPLVTNLKSEAQLEILHQRPSGPARAYLHLDNGPLRCTNGGVRKTVPGTHRPRTASRAFPQRDIVNER